MGDSDALFFDPAYLVLLAAIAAAVGIAVAALRRGVARPLVAVAAIDLLISMLIVALSSIHLIAVAGRAVMGRGDGPGGSFVYNFRFYSLVLVGVLLVFAAVACLASVRGLLAGSSVAHRRALWATCALLALNVPLMPIQGFAVAFSGFLLVNLAALVLTRGRFPATSIHRPPDIAHSSAAAASAFDRTGGRHAPGGGR